MSQSARISTTNRLTGLAAVVALAAWLGVTHDMPVVAVVLCIVAFAVATWSIAREERRLRDAVTTREHAADGVKAENAAALTDRADAITASITQLIETAGATCHTAGATASQAATLSVAGDEVSAGTNSVASALEEMQASISEIARGAVDASQTATEAVEIARSTRETIAQLGASSTAIGDVIEVISSIAEDT